jgi:hypothetical protein
MDVKTLQLPFISTSCCWDLRASLLLLPLWWILGLDQFIWPLLAGWIFIKWCLKHQELRMPKVFAVFLVMLMMFLVSATAIEESRRYLSFVRNLGVYCGGFLTIFLVVQTHRSIESVKKTFTTFLLLSMIVSLSGVLAILGADFSFQSLLGYLVPGELKVGYLTNIFEKTFTKSEASWFASGFVRPKGLMMYPNLLAGLILMSWPFKALYLIHASNRWKRWLLMFLVVDVVVVLHTLSRSAWVGGAVAFLLLLIAGRIPTGKTVQWVVGLFLVSLLMIPFGVGDIVTKRFVEKGHSNESRTLNYSLVLEESVKSPRAFAFGHGTQTDIMELTQPLGSHSTYFGILYKYGFCGLGLFVLFVMKVFKSSLHVIHSSQIKLWRHFGRALFCSLTVLFVQAMFVEIDVDVIYAQVSWIICGLAISLHEIFIRIESPDKTLKSSCKVEPQVLEKMSDG